MWTRWYRSGPGASIVTKMPWYFMGSIDTANYTGAPKIGQNPLAIWLGLGYYQFRGYNGASATSFNINYNNVLDASWNFVYVGYSKTVGSGTMTGWVQFADGTVQTATTAAVENYVQNFLRFKITRDPSYSG